MKYRLKRFSNTILKDFPQEEVYKFLNYRGTELYDDCKEKSVNDINSPKIKRGKYNKVDLEKYIKSTDITFRINDRTYKASDFLGIYNGKESLDKEYDIMIDMSGGFIEPDNGDIYVAMLGILPKYHKKDSTWEYKFLKSRNSSPKPILTIPTKKEELEDIVKIFCELAVFLKLFTGCYYKFYFTDTKNSKQKSFSDTIKKNLLSYIPTVLNTSYLLIGYPLIMGRLSKNLNELGKKRYGKDKFDKLLNYCEKIAKGNVYFVALGPISCYLDPQMIKKNGIEELKKEADSSRLRTMSDWILKAYEDKKHLIFYSDLDSPIALAHEFGHYLEAIDGTLGRIQRNDKKGIFSSGFIGFLAFILGLFGSVGEIIGTVSAMVMKSPLLLTEWMASYKGLKLMEESKIFTTEELKHTKQYFKTAWKTYLSSSYATASVSSIGRLTSLYFKNS